MSNPARRIAIDTFLRKPLASGLAAALALGATDVLAVQTVTNCADSGAGSLRSAVTNAFDGDVVVFNSAAMNCSTITLATGAIKTSVANLTINGPGPQSLTIDGQQRFRVLDHEGTGTLTVSGATLRHGYIKNVNANGGCVYSKGSLVVANSVVDHCFAHAFGGFAAYGGGVFASLDLTLTNTMISSSKADSGPERGSVGGGLGGGAYARRYMTIRSSTISSSSAVVGGGVAFSGNTTITGSTLSNNYALFGGALAILAGNAHLNMSDSTVSGNTARDGCGGLYLGRYRFSFPTVSISNSTVAFNTSKRMYYNGHDYAAGLCGNISLALQSTIVSNNHVVLNGNPIAADFSVLPGTTVTGANNLIVATLAGTALPPGTLTADPQLGPLANNGGAQMTHALMAGSPAIGAGNNAANLAYDERGPGFPRTTEGSTDIGAFQTGDGIFASGFE